MYLQCKLNDKLTIFKGLHFGFACKEKKGFRHKVTVGIGGNIGDVKRRFERLFFMFKKSKLVEIVKTSPILKNPPFGYKNQKDFFNAIVVLKTNMQPFRFLDYIMRLEKRFGRKRSFANAPRTLDLDIIFFDNKNINTPKLTIPHPHYEKRVSVLIPLAGLK